MAPSNPITLHLPSDPILKRSILSSLPSLNLNVKLSYPNSDRKDWKSPSFISK